MNVLRTINCVCCAALLVLAGQTARGFALLGPAPFTPGGDLSQPLPTTFGDAWETLNVGYGLSSLNTSQPGGPVWLQDLGGPKNVGEEYRRNIPVLYYAYDANFAGFFGARGEQAADQAFAIMNQFFTNYPNGVDGYSADLSEFPFNSQHFNPTAQNLYLTDLKSVTLHLLVEQMGLAEPERYTWTLHDRYQSPTPCPVGTSYLVVQRNLADTDQPLGVGSGTLYSPYVNNVLYTYGIADKCGLPLPEWQSVAIPFPVQPTAVGYTAVAANDFEFAPEQETAGIFISGNQVQSTGVAALGGLELGGFYTGLTRDDAAGLRYLMTSNNINYENPGAGSLLQATNDIYNTIVLMTSNLTDLVMFSLSNSPAMVETNFPGVIVSYSSNYWTVEQVPNVVAYYTNVNGQAFGNPPTLVITTNGFTPTPLLHYVDTFANVVTNTYSSNTLAYIQTISVKTQTGAAFGTPPFTNVTYTPVVLTNVPSGDYYLIPPGSCGYNILFPLYTNVTIITNIIQTNIVSAVTNIVTPTNTTTFFFQQNLVRIFTNHWYVAEPCFLVTNGPSWYQGIEKVQFVRVPDGNVDPLTQNFFIPITNTYTMNWYNPTNYTISTRTFQRIVTAPDILLSASDQALGPSSVPFNGSVIRNIHFNDGTILPNLAGPGVIDGQTVFDYNKVGTVFYNGPFPDTNSFIAGEASAVNETTQVPALLWASFDGSTNDPVVYPSSLSVQQLENQMLIAISPTSLPDGTNGVAYTVTFTATGGQAPYTWSTAGTPLPNGLSLNYNTGVLSGTPMGNPPGIYDFSIQMTDSTARVVTLNYTIIIH